MCVDLFRLLPLRQGGEVLPGGLLVQLRERSGGDVREASALSWLKLRLSVRFRLLSASASAPEVSGMASEDATEPEASNVAVTL